MKTITFHLTENSKGKHGHSVYEIHVNDKIVGWLSRVPNDNKTWQVDVETTQGQKFRRHHSFVEAKQMARELLATDLSAASDFHKNLVNEIEKAAIRLDNDVNGNPRYYISAIHFISPETKRMVKPYNGNVYRGRKYGSGYVFQSYNLKRTIEFAISDIHEVYF